MPGMNSGVNISDPTVVAAFKAALVHQGIIALLIFAVLGMAWVTVRAWLTAAASTAAAGAGGTAEPASAPAEPAMAGQAPASPAPAEPAWRTLLRIGFLSSWVNAFTVFDEAHGLAVNLFVVAALAVAGAAFLSGRPRLIRPVLAGFTVLCLADWVLVEDLGFLGGLGTDPNSMIPMVLLAAAGYLAVAREPAPAAEPAPAEPAPPDRWPERLRAAVTPRSLASAGITSVASVGAIGVIILGAAPMAVAQASPVADTILAQAINGSSTPLNGPAPAFSLTDQHGRTVTLASLRGKVVLLTFLDPVCTNGCPLEAQEFRAAGQLLGASDRHVELVAISANPVDYQVGYVQAFDRRKA